MRRPHLIAVTALGLLSAGLVIASFSLWVERPTVLRVAVSSADADDFDLVGAAAKLAKHGHHSLRLKVVPTDGVAQAAHALEQNEADLAVVRPDIAMPDKGETVVLLHKDVALLVAPGGGGIATIADLAGKRVGVVGLRVGDTRLMDAVLGQYDLASDTVTTMPLAAEAVPGAIKDKTVDAVFVVGQVSSPLMQGTVRAIAKAGEGAPVFIPVAEAAAIAERQPAYESIEVVKGAFGGIPSRPADDIDTLGITTRLVASADLGDSTVAALTRFLLSERVALAELAPVARRMTAPATDRGAVLPVHPGTAAYIDDEEETFLDKYSDFIYIGAMVLGVFASGLTAVIGRFGSQGAMPLEQLVARLLAILKQVRAAPTAAALDDCESECDAVVADALDRGNLRGFDERRGAALSVAIDQVRVAIEHRRDVLGRGRAAANDDPPPFEPILVSRLGSGERAAES